LFRNPPKGDSDHPKPSFPRDHVRFTHEGVKVAKVEMLRKIGSGNSVRGGTISMNHQDRSRDNVLIGR